MNKKNRKYPPRLAEWLLRTIHSDNGQYTHLGDFVEVYNSIYRQKGVISAWVWYCYQVFHSIPGFITNKLYWSITMFKNYFKIALRSVLKRKGFSFINITGLAVGLACFILILAYVQFELSFDNFHEKGDRLFRILSRDVYIPSDSQEFGDNIPDIIVPLLTQDFSEIINVTRYYTSSAADNAVLEYEGKNFYQRGLYADAEFLNMFTYPLIQGEVKTALKDPNCMVISEPVAQKLFGKTDPLGKVITYREKYRKYEMLITGIMNKIPANSHLQFDFLVSFKTLSSDKRNSYMFNTWDVTNFVGYVETITPEAKFAIEEKIPAFIAKHRGIPEEMARKAITVQLQPIKDIHLKSRIRGELPTNYEMKYVYLFSSIAFIILLIACVNYMNLTTARSTTRAKEIGIRKVVGANRRQLFKQFLGESLLTTIMATGIAMLLVIFLLPRFNQLIGVDLSINYINNLSLFFLVLGAALVVGVVSGTYPALVLSAFDPSHALKDQTKSGKGALLRNILVVVQFSASVILIISTLVIFKQLGFIKNTRLGYDREHVAIIPVQEQETGQKVAAIKNELLQHPEIQGVSITSGLPHNIRSRMIGFTVQKDNGEKMKMTFWFDYIDKDFLDVFKIELASGRNSNKESGEKENGILVNEAFVKKVGWAEPLGKKFSLMRDEYEVIGVIKDFHFATFHEEIEPMMLEFSGSGNLAIRITAGNVPERISLIRRVFEKHSQSQPFDFYFLDDAYDQLYKKEQRTGEIFGTFALIGIFIACLGLLGLASFSVEKRTKEIGIRKVMGASPTRIAGLLTKEFVKLVIIANIIAWPLAFFAMQSWLQDFAYRISLQIWIFLFAFVTALAIAFITICTQTLKAAMANPVDTLRYE